MTRGPHHPRPIPQDKKIAAGGGWVGGTTENDLYIQGKIDTLPDHLVDDDGHSQRDAQERAQKKEDL